MRQWKSSLLALGLAAICLAQSSSTLLTPEIRRVGMRLACLCRTCNNTVGECPMLQCHYGNPAKQKIAEMQAAGKPDDEIVKSFVQESGIEALSSPPTTGFSSLAWIMPWVAIALGLGAVYLFIRRVHPKRAAAGAPEMDPEVLKRYRDNIDKDLDKLD
jgi:cytochrome c-type biogenesis protein CcmH/NrfF